MHILKQTNETLKETISFRQLKIKRINFQVHINAHL